LFHNDFLIFIDRERLKLSYKEAKYKLSYKEAKERLADHCTPAQTVIHFSQAGSRIFYEASFFGFSLEAMYIYGVNRKYGYFYFISDMKFILPSLLLLLSAGCFTAGAQTGPADTTNLALTFTVSASYVSPWESLSPVNDGYTPSSSSDYSHGAYGNWNGEENYGTTPTGRWVPCFLWVIPSVFLSLVSE